MPTHQHRIGAVHDDEAARGDVAIDGGQTAEDDVEEEVDGVLADPVVDRVEVAGLERLEDGLDAVDVGVAVLAGDGVQLGLESERVRLLLVKRELASARVATEIAHVQFDVLGG